MSRSALFPLCIAGPAVAALALLLPAAAAQDDQPPEGFSILAPQEDDTPEDTGEAETDTVAQTQTAEAGDAPAGAWLDRDAYLARRGETDETVLRTRWRVVTTTLDGEETGREQREIVIGDGYTSEPNSENNAIHDFRTDRILTRMQTLDGPVMHSAPVTAHVHNQMNIFTAFTHGGELDEVTGPGGVQFERFWIEAALGVRLAQVDLLTARNAETGHVAVRRSELGSEIFGYDSDDTAAGRPTALFRAWMRHTLPVHPDALSQLDPQAGIPTGFSFLIFSPSSPEGRRETWTRLSASEGEAAFPWPDGLPAAGADSYAATSPAITRLLAAGFSALNGPHAAAPTDATFIAAAEAAQRRADPAGAYLALYQAAQHFGACPSRPRSETCTRMNRVTAAGLGDDTFEALLAAMSELQDDRPAAIEILRTHLHREGLAGAAANVLTAQAVAAEQALHADALPELAPLDLFASSAEDDPFAALTYWHAGRYAASLNDTDSAWLLFEIAMAMPGAAQLPPGHEAAAMRQQLRTLAPDFFGPAPAR